MVLLEALGSHADKRMARQQHFPSILVTVHPVRCYMTTLSSGLASPVLYVRPTTTKTLATSIVLSSPRSSQNAGTIV